MVSANVIGIIICAIILIAITSWFVTRKIKKNKLIKNQVAQIPQDILNDFAELERRSKMYGSSKSPQQILWEFIREKNNQSMNEREVMNNGTIKKEISSTGEVSFAEGIRGSSRGNSGGNSGRSSGTTSRQFQDTSIRRRTFDSESADGDIQRNRINVKGRNLSIQSDSSTPKDKRKSKINWGN